MATIRDMAFDYSMKRGHGKKAYENFYAGAKAVIQEIQQAYDIAGIDTAVDRMLEYYGKIVKE